MTHNHEYILSKDCPATAIPAGDSVSLKKGASVFVTQTLGGNVTVRTDQGLFRIARGDVDAIADFSLQAEAQAQTGEGEFSEQLVWDTLKTCFDPEIPVNIVDLGLVYDLAVEKTPAGTAIVECKWIFTASGCGMGPVIAEDARQKIAALTTVASAKVQIVWERQWVPQMISDAGSKVLGLE